jgi:hypothetical protein
MKNKKPDITVEQLLKGLRNKKKQLKKKSLKAYEKLNKKPVNPKRPKPGWLITMWERTGAGPHKMWEHVHIITKKQAMNAAVNKLREEMLDTDIVLWINKNLKAIIVNGEGDLLHSVYATLEKVYFYDKRR